MKNILAVAAVAVLLCAVSVAQSTNSPSTDPSNPQEPQTQPAVPAQSQPQTATPSAEQTTQNPASTPSQAQPAAGTKIAPGSVIPVQLTKTVDAKKAKQGDEVVAKVTQDLKTNAGELLVPKDSKVMGHVTQAQARNKEQKESELAIAFDRAETKNGDMQLPMSIQAIIAPPESNPGNSGGYEQSPSSSGNSSPSATGGGGRSPMSGSTQPPAQPSTMPTSGGSEGQSANGARPPITGNTQGVIGMPNLKLEASAQPSAQGSVVSSEKGNVKLESGTLLLLRVNQ
ncbi:MAG TPA: hypothetical protein VFE61_28500 [Candidatus Sulfotelmatobacter sp.]|jgi:hypothetical protein|nr:hypothetical protein [Candidatus Sulfotelmatobacter sp.]